MNKKSSSILNEIISRKKVEIEEIKRNLDLAGLKNKLTSGMGKVRSFKKAISKSGSINLIAELKKASPSYGIIREDFRPVELAGIYEKNGAAAISVLTEKNFFLGDINFLSVVKEVTSIPLLRKDFIIDEYQIYESRLRGADAILLIAAVLSAEELNSFLSLSRELDLDCLVEVHTEEELNKVLRTSADIIGINNRNLKSFAVEFSTTRILKNLIPPGIVVVSESGIHRGKDVQHLKDEGINAFLVGESLLRSDDVAGKIKELTLK